MFFPFKNRGILVPLYFVVCLIGVFIVRQLIEYLSGESGKTEYNNILMFAIAFTTAGHWTYNTRDSFYVANGVKKRMNEDNQFFFLSMEVWAYIYWVLGGFCIVAGLLSFLGVEVDFS